MRPPLRGTRGRQGAPLLFKYATQRRTALPNKTFLLEKIASKLSKTINKLTKEAQGNKPQTPPPQQSIPLPSNIQIAPHLHQLWGKLPPDQQQKYLEMEKQAPGSIGLMLDLWHQKLTTPRPHFLDYAANLPPPLRTVFGPLADLRSWIRRTYQK